MESAELRTVTFESNMSYDKYSGRRHYLQFHPAETQYTGGLRLVNTIYAAQSTRKIRGENIENS